MGHRCCGKQKVKRGLWSPEEDDKLLRFITTHGHASWSAVPRLAGLQRCGKSCRLRWINYLRPDLKRGSFTAEEEQIIIDVHRILGNKWAQIAKHLPGRTDNEVKNFWNSCIKKKLMSQGLDPRTHNLMPSHKRASASNNSTQSSTKTKQPLNQQQHQTFSIITVNPQTTKDSSPAKIINPPPFLPPSLADDNDHGRSHSTVTCYQTPITGQYNKQTNHIDPFIFYDGPSGQTIPMNDPHTLPPYGSSADIDISTLGLLDENHDHNTRSVREIVTDEQCFQAPMPMQAEEHKEIEDPMDVSFDSSNFDIDFAALFSSAMSSDFNPMDEFAWTF